MSDCNRNIPDLLPCLVTLQLHIIRCELIEVPDLRVQPEPRRREGVSADELLNGIHVDAIKELISRDPFPAPRFWLNPEIRDFYQFTPDDVKLEGYQTGEQIRDIPIAI